MITVGIARTTGAETALAAYGVAINIAVLLESPVQMLLPTANALTQDRQSYRLLRRFTISIGLALSGLLFLVASSPLGTLTVSRLIGAPPAVAQQVLITLLVMALWPLVVGWRRFYQGLLIRFGHTRAVGYGTACRLLTIAAVVILVVNGSNWFGALVGGLALMAGAVVEAVFVTTRAWPVIKAGWQNNGDELTSIATRNNKRIETPPPPHLPGNNQKQQPVFALAALVRFYIPLATTSVLTIVTWPLIAAGISRATEPTTSLAAWPVALSILWLLTTPIQMLQQVAIALIQSARSLHALVRFGLATGLLGSLLLASFAFTPLIDLFLQYIMAAPARVTPLVIAAARILVPLPLILAGQSLLQGLLISRGATGDVGLAMVINLVVLGPLLLGGIAAGRLPGAILAPIAMTDGLVTETAVPWWKLVIKQRWQARQGNKKRRAYPHPALDPDAAAVGFDDLPGDGQPQT